MNNEGAKFRMIGITDENTTCDMCGKIELRSTVMLAPLDADGNEDGELIYAGSTCAGRMLSKATGRRITAATVNKTAASVRAIFRNAQEWADEFRTVTRREFNRGNLSAAINAVGIDTSHLKLAQWWEETQIEVAAIDTGTLKGTRFEQMLPTI